MKQSFPMNTRNTFGHDIIFGYDHDCGQWLRRGGVYPLPFREGINPSPTMAEKMINAFFYAQPSSKFNYPFN